MMLIFQKIPSYHELRLRDIKSSIISILEAHYYDRNILNDAKTLLMEDNFDYLTETSLNIVKKFCSWNVS